MKHLCSFLLVLFLLPSVALAKSDSTCVKYDVVATYGINCRLGWTLNEMPSILGVHVEVTRNWYGGGVSFYSYNNSYNETDPFHQDLLDRYVYSPIINMEAGYIVGINGLLIPLRSKYIDLSLSVGLEYQKIKDLKVVEFHALEFFSDGTLMANVRHDNYTWMGISGRLGLMADVRLYERLSARLYASASTSSSMKVKNNTYYVDPWLSFGVGLKFNFNK